MVYLSVITSAMLEDEMRCRLKVESDVVHETSFVEAFSLQKDTIYHLSLKKVWYVLPWNNFFFSETLSKTLFGSSLISGGLKDLLDFSKSFTFP